MTSVNENSIRDYQSEAVDAVQKHLERNSRASIIMAEGTGKSTVVIEVARIFARERPVLILLNNLKLCEQLLARFDSEFGKGYAELMRGTSGHPTNSSVQLTNIQNLQNNILFVNQYSLVIVLDAALVGEKAKQLLSGFLASIKQLFLSSTKDHRLEDIAGTPIFEYTYSHAISDNRLKPIEYKICPIVNQKMLGNTDYVLGFLSELIDKYRNKSEFKALIICASIAEAENVYGILTGIDKKISAALLHSKNDSLYTNLDYAVSDECSIVVVVNLYLGIDIPNLTDLVLLRNFSSEAALNAAVSRIMRPSRTVDVGYVWDFAGNQHLFNREMGRLVNNEFEIKVSDDKMSTVEREFIAKTGDLVIPLEDKPAKVDLLGRKGLVDILKGLIERDTKDHLIIALFGHWGSGKSSVIQMLRDKYERNNNRNFIEFNAWQAEHSNSMAASIAQQLVNDLYKNESILGQIFLSFKARLLQSKTSLLIEFAFFAVITAFCFGFALPEVSKKLTVGYGVLATLTLILPTVFSLVISYLKHPFTGQLKELARRPNFKEHIGLGHAIREQIFCLLSVHSLTFWQALKKTYGKVVQKEHKYILAIDDLDRCSDKKIIETLEAIQLIVDLPCVNILLAVAPDILLDAVASRYMGQRHGLSAEGARQLARDFLGKVLQITITLDKPTSINRNQFINTRLYADMELEARATFNSQPKIKATKSKSQQPEEILDFTDFVDETGEDYDRTESYLKSNKEEYDFFVKCSDYFDIHNPRTLIRIHNAVTLLKGVYPNIYQSGGMLNYYIYLTFWHEVYATVDSAQKKLMLNIILPDVVDLNATAASDQILSFENVDRNEIKTMLFRVKNMSLPAIELT